LILGGAVGEIEARVDLGRLDPHHQLAGDGIALAELLGAMCAHVPSANPSRDVEQVLCTVVHGSFFFAALRPATNE
jgi:hypothetical protein